MLFRSYSKNSAGICVAVDSKTAVSGEYYTSATCATKVSFQAQNFPLYCKEGLTATPNPILGNPAMWATNGIELDPLSTISRPASKWTLSIGAQMAVGVEPIAGNSIPYMKRVNYKDVNGCSLEMRIFKKDLNATNLTPLMWIHGGSWQYRGAFAGVEALVSSYTDAGFVVFAPFYRLANNVDGNSACNNAPWQEVMVDAESALGWVKANSAAFGAPNTGKIPIIGQSAGGHMAGWLVTHKPADVSRAVMLYPPADFNDFLKRMRGTNGMSFPGLAVLPLGATTTVYNPNVAIDILKNAFQIPDINTLDTAGTLVTENSFGAIVKKGGPANFPPVMILHGASDGLVTYTQSQALCEGYGGVVNVGWTDPTKVRSTFMCGQNSYLHVIKEANHMFEVCFPGLVCFSGSSGSATQAADSLKKGRNWLLNPANIPMP